MPDQEGKLTAAEKKKIADWLTSFGRSAMTCPICGANSWIIGDHLVQAVTLGPNQSMQLGGLGYPQIMLISTPCGHTVFVNAVMAGVLPSVAETEKKV